MLSGDCCAGAGAQNRQSAATPIQRKLRRYFAKPFIIPLTSRLILVRRARAFKTLFSPLAPKGERTGTLLPGAAEIAGNLPAAGLLEVAHLVAAEPGECLAGDKADLAARRGYVKKHLLIGIGRRSGLRDDAHEGHAELLADRRIGLGGVAHFEAVLERIAPF